MKNFEIAKIFYDMADLLDLQGVDFKPQAYRKGARVLEGLAEDVEVLVKQGKLRDLPGIGEKLAEKIEEYVKTGKIAHYYRLKKRVPGKLDELLTIPGMGPKKAKLLYKKLKIDSIEKLEKAAKEGKIRILATFGEKSEKDILDSLQMQRKGASRMLLGKALPIAREIVSALEQLKEVDRIEIAGSLRRRMETIGDIDILITSDSPEKVMSFFTSMPRVVKVIANGPTKSSILLKDNIQVDLRVLDADKFGSGLLYFTGNKDHNISLRNIAIKKGMKLSEYGLFKGERSVASKTEQDVFSKLGMRYIEPELRQNQGEIEAAIAGRIPELIHYGGLKGDLQMHTKFSDGAFSIKAMAEAAQKMGYEYIAITDHSKSVQIAGGMDEKRFLRYVDELRQVQKEMKGIRVIASAEVDILADGSLDYDDKLLKMLDLVTVSIHSNFKMEKDKQTQRLIHALENKYVDILNHPTGRKIGQRPGYEFDFDEVVKTAVRNKVHLEINSLPDRLDLSDVLTRRAKELGASFTISTDAHRTEELNLIEYGISVARRAGLTKEDVINTRPLKDLPKYFKRFKL